MTELGQSFERNGQVGSLYTVVKVERRYASAFNGEAWYVTLLCVIPPEGWTTDFPGRRFNEIVEPRDLQRYGYTRLA